MNGKSSKTDKDIVQRLKKSVSELTHTKQQSRCKDCVGYRNVLMRNIKEHGSVEAYNKVMNNYLKHMSSHS
jgi:hypothetical protein